MYYPRLLHFSDHTNTPAYKPEIDRLRVAPLHCSLPCQILPQSFKYFFIQQKKTDRFSLSVLFTEQKNGISQ